MPEPHLIFLDEAMPSEDVPQRSCWSMHEGCVCRWRRDHFGTHECDDEKCRSKWFTEEGDAWLQAESEAHQKGGTVPDKHRRKGE